MVSSYYNSLPYSQKHSAANLAYSAAAATQPWNWPTNYHTPTNHQFLSDIDSPHAHHQMYYNHHHMFHTAAAPGATTDWHSPISTVADNFAAGAAQNVPTTAHQLMQQHHQQQQNSVGIVSNLSNGGGGGSNSSSGSSTTSTSNGPTSGGGGGGGGGGNTQMNETNSSIGVNGTEPQHIAEGLPSPPITVSGSEISSPGVPASASSPHHITHHLNSSGASSHNNSSPSTNNSHISNNSNNNNNTLAHNNNRASPSKHPYFEWMKKPAYPAQPQPGTYTDSASSDLCSTASLDEFTELLDSSGKTRTKDKYRVVYTDHQRLELEKEYCTSRYITIRRKSELAQFLTLSERQVKIWFQNRRAKERKQNKKGSDPTVMSSVPHTEYVNLMADAKTKLEPGLHLPHHAALHSMSPMAAMSMNMRLPPHLAHSHLAAAHSHQLHHQHQMSAAAAASVGTLSM